MEFSFDRIIKRSKIKENFCLLEGNFRVNFLHYILKSISIC